MNFLAQALVAAFVTLTTSASDFTRAEPTPEEISLVETCVDSKGKTADRRACIGVIANPCRAMPDGGTRIGRDACISREYDAWRDLLTRYERAIEVLLSDEDRRHFGLTQERWSDLNTTICEWPAYVYKGGTEINTLSGTCLSDQTALRAIDLKELLEYMRQR